jgi:hypothetical protein
MPADEPPFNSPREPTTPDPFIPERMERPSRWLVPALWAVGIGAAIVGLSLWAVILL